MTLVANTPSRLKSPKIYIPTENVSLYSDALVISEKPIFWENREDLLLNPLVIVEVGGVCVDNPCIKFQEIT